MRVGGFVLAAQFPGQGQGEALHRAVRSAEVAEEAGLDAVWLAEHHFVPYGAARRRSRWPRCCWAVPGGSASARR